MGSIVQTLREPQWIIYGIFYFLGSQAGLYLAAPGTLFPHVWISAGIALTGTLRHGPVIWPGIWLGGFCSLLLADLPLFAAGGLATGSAIEAALGAWLIRQLMRPAHIFDNATNMTRFLLIGALLTPITSALIGAGALRGSGLIDDTSLAENLSQLWMAACLGILLVTPLSISWLTPRKALSNHQYMELSLLFIGFLLACALFLGKLLPDTYLNFIYLIAPVPLVVWATLRFDSAITTLLFVLLASIAISSIHLELGPFVNGYRQENFFQLAVTIGSLGATLYVGKAAVNDYLKARKNLTLTSKIIANISDGILVTDLKGIIFFVNNAFLKNTGYKRSDLIGRSPHKLSKGLHDKDFFNGIWRSLRRQGSWSGEISSRSQSGKNLSEWLSISVITGKSGSASHYIWVYSDIAHQKGMQERIRHLAYYDSLTSLPNRQLFSDRLSQALVSAKRHGDRLGLIFLDLDRFKNINDTLGHTIGDLVLKATAKRLKECVRQTDTLARLGGDEFTVILQEIQNNADVTPVAEKILTSFKRPFEVGEHELFISPSIGIALYPEDGTTNEDLIKHADTAMYRSKETGGNDFQFFATQMSEPFHWNLAVETALRGAIEVGTIDVIYQPQFNLRTGSITGLEALARWHDSNLKDVPPDTFIKVAENTGLIHRLGDKVLEMACKQIKRWDQLGIDTVQVAINVSTLQLKQKGFTDRVKRIIDVNGISPEKIEFEITETSLMENAEFIGKILTQLSSMRFEIAVDDFGTGYSSLSYLKRLPLDRLKIDRSFVMDTPENNNDSAICSAIIAMAHSLGLKALAEGAEEQKQVDFLRKEKCDEIQGYFFSKPVSAEEVTEMIRQGYWHKD